MGIIETMSNTATPKVTLTIIEDDMIEVAVRRHDLIVIEEIIDWAYEAYDAHPVSDELCEENPEYFTALFISEERPDFVAALVASLLTQLPGCGVAIQ